MRTKLIGLVAISATLGVACGSGSSSDSSTGPRQSVTTTSPAVNPADQALAKQFALSLSDFPPGWISAPHSDTNNAEAEAQRNACVHLPPGSTKLIPNAASADSPDFTSPDQVATVKNTVSVAASAAKITAVLDLLESPDTPRCLATYFDSLFKTAGPKGAIGAFSVNPLSAESLGDRTVALRATALLSAQGESTNIYADIFVVQKGRVAVVFNGLDAPSPFDTDTATQLIQKVLAKIPASTG